MSETALTRDDLATKYLDQLPFEPYPVQEEALLAWFSTDEGVLVCAPTGMGKTLIAEAAAFEALHTRQICYYTTPLIALTEQKFRELQEAAVRWGFHPDDVGLVTGNRRVNPDARVLVVVAEILVNRLLNAEQFDFGPVSSVVMDEFHSFADPERGIVWELSLALLPKHVRLLLLSATVGNAAEFLAWLKRSHGRRLELVQSNERRVPLTFEWVGDKLLPEQLELMAQGDEDSRKTPALVFCFNRNECWDVAETLKGKQLVSKEARQQLERELAKHDWSKGAGPKLKRLLQRGVGVHHAGVLPKYRRIVEELFQRKLLQVCVCTETLAAGINLPARSVVLSTLLKGAPGKKTLISASSAHQIFGRAGRPQYDTQGFVYVMAHEDDVKLHRWQQKYDQIPADTKDPNLLRVKKQLERKRPTRRKNVQYWNESQFRKLQQASPGNLVSRGPLPWRLLAYLLKVSPEVERLKDFCRKRLMDAKRIERSQKELFQMLLTLWHAGYVVLEPEPPFARACDELEGQDEGEEQTAAASSGPQPEEANKEQTEEDSQSNSGLGTLGALLREANVLGMTDQDKRDSGDLTSAEKTTAEEEGAAYEPVLAHPRPAIDRFFVFRSINPLYGMFLLRELPLANREERIQALESVLEMPASLRAQTRPPRYDELPPGPLTVNRLDPELLRRGLALPAELTPHAQEEDQQRTYWDERHRVLFLAEKLKRLFDSELPRVHSLRVQATWAVGELLRFNGDFDKYVRARDLTRQEGIIFRHLLRFILLCGEFLQFRTDDPATEWLDDLREVSDLVTAACRDVDPLSTDKIIEHAQQAADIVTGEAQAKETDESVIEQELAEDVELDDFGAGVWDDD